MDTDFHAGGRLRYGHACRDPDAFRDPVARSTSGDRYRCTCTRGYACTWAGWYACTGRAKALPIRA